MSETSVNIWATGDGMRVEPVTGKYLEDRADIHADYPAGDYRSRNAAWDAASGAVRLRAARNEFVAFQVIVESAGPASPGRSPVRGVQVRLSGLRGPGGASIAGRNVALFKAWYLHVTAASTGYEKSSLGPGWYPDALLPAAPGEPVILDIPDERNGIGPAQRNHTVWVDVYVPRDRADAPPGKYVGELTVSWPGGRRTISVELAVWDFALPDEIHCRGDIWNGSIRHMPADLERAYYQLTRQHRFQPGVYAYQPEATVTGRQVKIDWTAYDARLRGYLDGSAFSEPAGYWGPGVGVPLDHLMLPFNCERGDNYKTAWPAAIRPDDPARADAEAAWVETARQFVAHFDADANWRRVGKVLFLNGLDESYNQAAYAKMIYYSELVRRALPRGWFQYRIDGGYEREALEQLVGHVDLWVCHTIGFDADKMAHYRGRGVEPWFYGPMIYEREANSACGSNTFLDLDLLTGRGVGWAAWKHKCGYCEWEFDAYHDRLADIREPERNWTEAINFRSGPNAFNGSGVLIYRGSVMGLPGPVPSIRLKAHRRGFQDYEYLWLLGQAGRTAEADRLVDSIIHATPFGQQCVGNIEVWRNNPEAWDAARVQAGELLAAGG